MIRAAVLVAAIYLALIAQEFIPPLGFLGGAHLLLVPLLFCYGALWLSFPAMLGLAAFLVTVIALGLAAVDWTWRNMEMNALVTAVETSEAAMGRTQDDLREAAARLGASGSTTDAQKDAVIEDLIAGAERGEMRIGSAGDVVGQVEILPWHRDILDAKEIYLAHNRSWQDYMAEIAADPKVYGTDQPLIDETFTAADPIMRAAVPDPPLFDLAQRVDRIFVEGAAPAPPQGDVGGDDEPEGQEVVLRVDRLLG